MYQPKLAKDTMNLHTGAVPGDEVVPDGRIGAENGGDIAGPLGGAKAALATAKRTGITEVGSSMATEN